MKPNHNREVKSTNSSRQGRYSAEFRNPASGQISTFRSGTTLNTFRAIDHEKKTDRQKERDLRSWRRRLGYMLMIVVTISTLGLILISQFSGSFTEITSNATSLSSSDAATYKKLVDDYMSKNPFERFSFARRGTNLDSYLSDKAPEIESVEIVQSNFLLGKLKFTFRQPVAKWIASGTTSYVDGKGVVFKKNFFEQPSVAIDDNSGASVEGGDAITSSRFLSFIGQTTAEIAKQGGEIVKKVVIPTGAIRYVEFYLEDRGYPFKAQIDRYPVSQAADIVAMSKFIDSNSINPSYVDVRIAGKAYWK